MNSSLRRYSLITSTLSLLAVTMVAQTNPRPVPAPMAKDFAGTLSFLSSDWMEGREAGTRGSLLAADYIASMMQLFGLKPYGDPDPSDPGMSGKQEGPSTLPGAYFQNFKMPRYQVENIGSFTLIMDKPEVLVLRNVLGIIYGKDTSRSILVGAHYDHLGISDGQIYNGADDNASGVCGMLALAKAWAENGEPPACNIIFAAWTAEENGRLGSRYFVQQANANPLQVLAYLNLDMISRSAPEDSTGRQLSIGTMTGSEGLRQMAVAINGRLSHPFELDLWDVTGHTGSDYASFTAKNIPVMTFFSGFQVDYHTPADDAPKADLQKMEDILEMVNDCLWHLLAQSQRK